ncbi:hypothetical protein BU24DRAFT_400052 [Aaosphaeria arxii CBS 175.79]|uniref:CoA-dependent acyltransferase n=1 Tax=Aaosphaeria arxii CBS 175.79 TaxID=1450172 RepID=A0A6A5XCU7_9PLEO|nr:uncharacterized protein BU24DRAFT_400052 [Aaosphaeria arxii CBS 175.79]KAF2010594.1 hypothetical protein BU24DRAFT_400052 [Aaosphaeria arxii CBS 175.79]
MSPYDNGLVWQQTAPGLWERGIDEIEEFYATMKELYRGSGRMFFAMTGYLSLNVDISSSDTTEDQVDDAIKKAWLTLRYDHPTLASQVVYSPGSEPEWKKQYRPLTTKLSQDEWLNETVVIISNGQTGTEWVNSDPPAPEIPTLFLIHPPKSTSEKETASIRRDIVFRSPHDIIDGVGTLMMLNSLLNYASKTFEGTYIPPILDGSESANLSPSYRIAANLPPTLTPAQTQLLESIIAQKTNLANPATNPPDLSLPYKPSNPSSTLPGKHQRSFLTLTAAQTTALLTACKTSNMTPTHAFHAAAALVLLTIQPTRPTTTKEVRYTTYILRNERRTCVPPYDSAAHAAALYHSVSGASLAVDLQLRSLEDERNFTQQERKEEFRDVVKRFSDYYLAVKYDEQHTMLVPSLWALGIPKLPSKKESELHFPVPPPRVAPSVSMSSMGRVDEIVAPEVGRFRVGDVWVTGEELGNGLGLFLGTFKGELTVSAAWNDAWHEEKEVLDFLERCRDIVFEGLEIGSI